MEKRRLRLYVTGGGPRLEGAVGELKRLLELE